MSTIQISGILIVGLLIGAALAVLFTVRAVKWFLRFLAARAVSGILQVGERQLGRVVGVGEKHLDKALEAGGKEIAKGVASLAEDARKNDPKRLESEVARLAQENQGVLTVAKVMADLQLPQFKSQEILARLVRSRVCKMDQGPLGSRYLFEAFLATTQQFRCPFCENTFTVCPENRICTNCGGNISAEVVQVLQSSS
ncbi:hypothetical protein IV102_30185 [bacterium]|nr:hypothetical protein [bacterium]